MAPFKPPADATVIDDSGLVSVYRMADGQILFVDESPGVPFGIFGTLLLRLFFLTTFMLLATAPAIVGADIPATWLWYLSGTVIAVMALLITGYFKHIRIWGRWEKQRELYYEPGAQQWYCNENRLAAYGTAPTLEVVSDTYRDRYRPSENRSESQKIRTEIYYLYLRTGNNTNHLLLRTKTFKKARAIATLLEDQGMPQLVARGFAPPTRD